MNTSYLFRLLSDISSDFDTITPSIALLLIPYRRLPSALLTPPKFYPFPLKMGKLVIFETAWLLRIREPA